MNQSIKEIKFSDLNLLDIGHTIQISGTVWSGQNKNILCIFPDEDINSNEWVILKMTSQEWEKFLRQTDLLEIEILQQGPQGITKAIVRKSQRQIDQVLMWRVFRRDNYTCQYCGQTGVPLTVDHLILWEERGPTIEANLLTACKNCNKARGKMPYTDWLKSPYYLRISQNLSETNKQYNKTLVELIKTMPRVQHIRSR